MLDPLIRQFSCVVIPCHPSAASCHYIKTVEISLAVLVAVQSRFVSREFSTLLLLLQVVAWYDNEWGYSQRVLDLAEITAKNFS